MTATCSWAKNKSIKKESNNGCSQMRMKSCSILSSVVLHVDIHFRTALTFVTAHTFYASRDTRVSYGWCLLIQGYFCVV